VDDLFKRTNYEGTFAYLDNITVGGSTQVEHDRNLHKFLEAARSSNLTFNRSKCVFSTDTLDLLGYRITKGCLMPDPDRV